MNSPWQLDQIISRTPLRQVRGQPDLLISKDLLPFTDLNKALHQVAVENTETGKTFQYYWQDGGKDICYVHVKCFSVHLFKHDKDYYIITHERESEAYQNTLMRTYQKGEKTPVDELEKQNDGQFHARHDYKSEDPKRKQLLKKVILFGTVSALLFFLRSC